MEKRFEKDRRLQDKWSERGKMVSNFASSLLLLDFGTNKPEKREGDDYQSSDDACFIFLQALS